MYQKPDELGLTNREINEICDRLWAKRDTIGKCPDCAVKANQRHETGCDVARCTICSHQYLSCNCWHKQPSIWDGLWPGTRECYELKLICWNTHFKEWMFDYNELALRINISLDN